MELRQSHLLFFLRKILNKSQSQIVWLLENFLSKDPKTSHSRLQVLVRPDQMFNLAIEAT